MSIFTALHVMQTRCSALHVMQTRCSDENFVRLSVPLSVCHMRGL